MIWQLGLVFGMAGGAIVELVALGGNLLQWRSDRATVRRANRRKSAKRQEPLQSWREYIDLWPDLAVAVTRLVFGAIGGLIFHSQVTSPLAAIAVGASAPALLRQFGSARNIDEIADEGSSS